MIRPLLAAIAGIVVARAAGAQPVPTVTEGRIVRLDTLRSRFVDARHVDVWLPPGYDGTRRFPVLYMHDGQMLFDSTITWNRQAWGVHATVARLVREGAMRPLIVVGVRSAGKRRHAELFP